MQMLTGRSLGEFSKPIEKGRALEVSLPDRLQGRFSPDCFAPGSSYICAVCVFLESGGLCVVLHMNEIPWHSLQAM